MKTQWNNVNFAGETPVKLILETEGDVSIEYVLYSMEVFREIVKLKSEGFAPYQEEVITGVSADHPGMHEKFEALIKSRNQE